MKKAAMLLCAAILAYGFIFSQTGPVIPKTTVETSGSDAKAIQIANEVMQAMGGQEAWNNTHFISWNFFGRRTLLWDKWTGKVRIEWAKRPLKIIVNVIDGTGKVSLNGVEQTHPDSLSKYLDLGKKVWINDSYWLVMPFKMRDPGVTLKYLGMENTTDGREADKIQLTFKSVGVTPDNKYHVWVDKKSRLVTQWAYFEKFSDEKPQIQNAWTNYQKYGKILLSDGRGKEDGSSLAPVQVLKKAPEGAFERF